MAGWGRGPVRLRVSGSNSRVLPYREVRRRLLAAGFEELGATGSHVKFVKIVPAGTRTAIVPKHREVARGTLRSILRQAGLSVDEFEEL